MTRYPWIPAITLVALTVSATQMSKGPLLPFSFSQSSDHLGQQKIQQAGVDAKLEILPVVNANPVDKSTIEPALVASASASDARRISYTVDEYAPIHIKVYNMLGRQIATLVDTNMQPGDYSVCWDGQDDSGAIVSSGPYWYRIEIGERHSVRKVTLPK